MAQLVRDVGAGRAVVTMGRQPPDAAGSEWVERVAAYSESYSRWLAKHARLLARLRLDIWEAQVQHVTAGLRAAAGLAVPELAHRRTTRSQAAITAAATAAAAAAPPVGGHEQQEAHAGVPGPAQLLPLTSLELEMTAVSNLPRDPAASPLLHSLAACPQLTQLRVRCHQALWQEPQLAAALGALPQLRELHLYVDHSTTCPTMPPLPQLATLRLIGVELEPEGFAQLPVSLQGLSYLTPRGGPLKRDLTLGGISHLTRLTALSCGLGDADAATSLPASLEQLCLGALDGTASLQSLQHLSALGRLELCNMPLRATLPDLQGLVAGIGPSLTSLDLICVRGEVPRALLTQRVEGRLPLTGLEISHVAPMFVPHLGQWTALHSLGLYDVRVLDTPQQLADQISRLTQLRKLALQRVLLPRRGLVLQPVVDCVVRLPHLVHLIMIEAWTTEQAAAFKALTRLTHVDVF